MRISDWSSDVCSSDLRTNPNVVAVMLQDAIVEFLLGNFQQAQNVAEQVLTVAPNLPQALLVAGHSAFQLEQFEKARVHLGSYLVHKDRKSTRLNSSH